MITTTTLFLVQVVIVSWIVITAPEDCPKKYMKLIEDGGELQHHGQIHDYCKTSPLPYGKYYWVLKEEFSEKNNKSE
tara:strand:+ start:1055 stop:1285 length:231 start_codon:yes stop_codon:yes gene_type:complete